MANGSSWHQRKVHAGSYSCCVVPAMCFVLCYAMPFFFFLRPTRHTCSAHECRAMSCAIPCLWKKYDKFFFRRAFQAVGVNFPSLCTFFGVHMPLVKFNNIKNSKLKPIFNNNKQIIVREYNINN